MHCAYVVYEDTYDKLAEAIAHDDLDAVGVICSRVWLLDGADAFAGGAGMADAINGLPKRAVIGLCRLGRLRPCNDAECRHLVH